MNRNIILAVAFSDEYEYWRDYALATFCPRRCAMAVDLQERYARAYRYLLRRANR